MDLIIGGAYQGKLDYAKERFGLTDGDCFDLALGDPEAPCKCFYHFEALTERAAAQGADIDRFVNAFTKLASRSAVISREIGSGIVPMDEKQRYWREFHGMALSRLAKSADSVTRIFCGLEEVLK